MNRHEAYRLLESEIRRCQAMSCNELTAISGTTVSRTVRGGDSAAYVIDVRIESIGATGSEFSVTVTVDEVSCQRLERIEQEVKLSPDANAI